MGILSKKRNEEEWRNGRREKDEEKRKEREREKKGLGFLYMHVFLFLKKNGLTNLICLASKYGFGWRINKFHLASSLTTNSYQRFLISV